MSYLTEIVKISLFEELNLVLIWDTLICDVVACYKNISDFYALIHTRLNFKNPIYFKLLFSIT